VCKCGDVLPVNLHGLRYELIDGHQSCSGRTKTKNCCGLKYDVVPYLAYPSFVIWYDAEMTAIYIYIFFFKLFGPRMQCQLWYVPDGNLNGVACLGPWKAVCCACHTAFWASHCMTGLPEIMHWSVNLETKVFNCLTDKNYLFSCETVSFIIMNDEYQLC